MLNLSRAISEKCEAVFGKRSKKNNSLLCFLILFLYVVSPALAQTGDWRQEEGGRIRISFDAAPRGVGAGEAHGLIEVELKEGWKTYWKNPGSSGFAPELEVIHSQPDAQATKLAAQLLFPTPRIIPEKKGNGQIYGYYDHVHLPFRLSLPSRTGKISGKLLIGLCDDVCMPIGLDFTFDVGQLADFLTKGRIEAALLAAAKANDDNIQVME